MVKGFSILFLEGFHGGNLTVNAHYGVMFMSNLIKPKGDGHLVVTPRFRGPKEWSPHGVVPKEWLEVMRLMNACSHISVAYKKRDKSEVNQVFAIVSMERPGIYFVPGYPGRIPKPP